MTDQHQQPDEKSGTAFIVFLSLTVKYRRFLFWFIFLITVGTTLYAILTPKWFKSTASVLPAEKNDLLSTLSGISNLAKGFSATRGLAALTGQNSETDKYMAILKSSKLTDDVIKKFDLRGEYEKEKEYYEKVVLEWRSNLELEIQDEGNLTITVYDKDPQKAADIANYMVNRLNEINTDLNVTNAKANREFIEKRYSQNVTDINNLETGMKKFQEKYGVIAVPEQLEATVKSMSSIYVELYKKEIEFNVQKQTYGIDHPVTTNSKIELNELRKKIDQLNAGTDPSQKDVKLLIPFKTAPELGNEYLKIFRNLEIQYKILEFIQPLYEQAKIEEVRNTPSVLILDKAGPPERKARPKIMVYAFISFIGSIVLAYLAIFAKGLIETFRMEHYEEYNYLLITLRQDLKNMFSWKKS